MKNKLPVIFISFASAIASFGANVDFYGSTDSANPFLWSSTTLKAPWVLGTPTTSSGTVLWKGYNGSTIANGYVLIDTAAVANDFLVSGTGGTNSNLHLVFDNATYANSSLSLYSTSNALNFNSHYMNFYFEGTGTVNFAGASGGVDLSSGDASAKSINFASGITVNSTGTFTIKGVGSTGEIASMKIAGTFNAGASFVIQDNATVDLSGATINLVGATGTAFQITSLNNVTLSSSTTVNADLIKLSGTTFNATSTFKAYNSGATQTVQIISNSTATNLSTVSTSLSASAVKVDDGATLNIASYATVGSLSSTTITSASSAVLFLDKGCTFNVGNGTSVLAFNYYGTSTVKGDLIINSKSALGHGISSSLGNMTVDGGTITENNSTSSSYNLGVTGTVNLKNGSSATISNTNNYLGIGGGTLNIDETSVVMANKIAIYASNSKINFTKVSNFLSSPNLFIKDAASGSQISFVADETAYVFNGVNLLRNSSIAFDLNGAEIQLGSITGYSPTAIGASTFTFYDFTSGLVKVDNWNTELISSGTFALTNNANHIVTLVGYDRNGVLLSGGTWGVDANNYLFYNVVPEPAAWAAILGALALGFSAYKKGCARRKAKQ